MIQQKLARTEYLILRKTPYKESSLIVSGISPSFGKIDFIVRGAKKISKTKLPFVDIFREINVEFDTHRDGLKNIFSAELLSHFDNIASFSSNYQEACVIASFLLRNTHFMIECPFVYNTMKNALVNLSSDKNAFLLWPSLVKLVFLSENGLLPDNLSNSNSSENEKKRRVMLEKLFSAAAGETSPPELSLKYINRLSDWIDNLCRYNDLM